jgi:hypothetical protein
MTTMSSHFSRREFIDGAGALAASSLFSNPVFHGVSSANATERLKPGQCLSYRAARLLVHTLLKSDTSDHEIQERTLAWKVFDIRCPSGNHEFQWPSFR